MHKIIISLICCLLPTFAFAELTEIRKNAPDRHIVVKGDTLWDISAEFFKDPWKWPEIWGFNKATIKDPHWIYPGDVIILDRTNGTLHVNQKTVGRASSGNPVIKLSPKVRGENSEHNAIPSIPVAEITPFLSRPLLISKNELANAPTIVESYEQHDILAKDDVAYVSNLPTDKGSHWQVYHAGKRLIDPDTKEVLSQEAIYLGNATVEKFAKLSTVRISKSILEIVKGDHLVQSSIEHIKNYFPHAPDQQIAARVISIYGGASMAGLHTVITLNKGHRDGLEDGHVLALFHRAETFDTDIKLPDTRYGLLLVFRTFDKVSYALVMQSTLPVELLDQARTP